MTAAKYRKKPVVIEAMRFLRTNGRDVWEWADSKPMYDHNQNVIGLRIYTLEGDMKAEFGDWVVKGVKGEFYPVKDDIFRATYEPVEA